MTALLYIKKRNIGALGILACTLLTFNAQADTALERGKASAMVCAGCHQADGNGLAPEGATAWPRLAGLKATYLVNQLQAFKSGERKSAEMKPFADMLNDDQIQDVSAWYASLDAKAPSTLPAADDAVLESGEKLALHGDWDRYIAACVSCHGPGNQGVGTAFPDIAGQHPGYIASQLHAWRNGDRTNDPLGVMHAVAKRLDDTDIAAVSAWLGRQAPANGSSDTDTGDGAK